MTASYLSYLQLIRLPNGFTALSNILAGAIIAPAITQTHANWQNLPYLILASLFLYYGGMALNDCFDISEDQRERPDRPLPSGAIKEKLGWTIALGLMCCGLLLAFLASQLSFTISCLLFACIFAYNGFSKRYWFGAVVMGLCRYFNWLLALSICNLNTESLLVALPIFFYITALTYLSKEEVNAEKKAAVFYCLFLLICSFGVILSLLLNSTLHGLYPGLIALSLLANYIFYKLYAVFINFEPSAIQALVQTMVLGVIPLDAVMLIAAGFPLYGLLVLLLLIPGKQIAKKIYVT